MKVKAIDQAAVGIVDSRLILITNASNKLVTQVTSRCVNQTKTQPLHNISNSPNDPDQGHGPSCHRFYSNTVSLPYHQPLEAELIHFSDFISNIKVQEAYGIKRWSRVKRRGQQSSTAKQYPKGAGKNPKSNYWEKG